MAYARFSGVVIGAEDLQKAPSEVREALLRYVEMGGSMVLIGQAWLPPAWKVYRKSSKPGADVFETYTPGFGEVRVFSGGRRSFSNAEKNALYLMWNYIHTEMTNLLELRNLKCCDGWL